MGAVLLFGCGGSKHNAQPPAPTTIVTTVAPGASTTTVAAATTTTVATNYVVKHGDTLSSIANHFHITVAALMRANNITNPDKVEEGQQLVIPAAHPATLTVTPPTGAQGESFALKLTGAESGEAITFRVRSPKATFTGPAHVASADGSVTATYKSAATDPTGKYTVTATGNKGTTGEATFTVTAAATTHT